MGNLKGLGDEPWPYAYELSYRIGEGFDAKIEIWLVGEVRNEP
jgi:hypothetical protein